MISAIAGGSAFPVSGLKPNTNGTIWILGGANGGSAVSIDGSNLVSFGLWANFALTLKGAWNGLGTNTTTASASSFTVPISITNWNNNVTLSDITISGTSGVPAGLTVTTTKNITLTRVQSNGNSNEGAYLDNSVGTGTVTVTSSQFNTNGTDGLDVYSNGMIALSTVTANSNSGGVGAYLDNSLAFFPQAVNITGTNNTFNNDYLNGLLVFSFGNITAGNLHADGNSIGYENNPSE